MFLAVSLTLLGFLLTPQPASSSTPVVTNAQGQFRVIKFPQRWLEEGSRKEARDLITTAEYEIRQDKGPAKTELFFGALSLESHRYSQNLYAVRPGSSTIRLVPRPRWERAQRIDTESEHIFPVSDSDKPSVYEYAGRKYSATGKSGDLASISPGRKYLAVMSYRDAHPPPRLFPPLGGGEAMRGIAYWEVYNTASGARVISGQMSYSGQSAGIMFSSAVWVDDRYFVLPLDNQYQSFLVGLLR